MDQPISPLAISTIRIEAKVLLVDGKQLTLAVFRQIEEEGLFWGVDDYPQNGGKLFQPKGQVLGYVNYCPDADCSKVDAHMHLLWQKGSELRRWRVVRPDIGQARMVKIMTILEQENKLSPESLEYMRNLAPAIHGHLTEKWEEWRKLGQLFIAV